MGWASFLGGLAADAARDYVNKRGIDGVMEDASNIASGVKNFFSDSSSSVSWDDITSHVSELVKEGQYVQALEDFDQYYREYEDGVADVYYYYWRSQILMEYLDSSIGNDDFADINEALNEAISNCREFRNPEINQNLEEIANRQKAAIDFNLSLKQWEKMMSDFNALLDNNKPQDALELLEYHYKTEENGAYDFFYYEKKYLATVIFISNEKNYTSTFHAKAYETLKECYENMKDVENPSEGQIESIKSCKEWMQDVFKVKVQYKCNEYIELDDYSSAEKLVINEFKYAYPQEYRNAISRIKSLYLISLVDKKETSIDKIDKALKEAENALSDATVNEESEETKRTRLETVSPRISRGQEYLEALKSSKCNVPYTQNKASEFETERNEAEYLEELKACFEDGVITDRERRLLNRLRKSLGISDTRASELEAMCNPNILSVEEQEYADEVNACLEDDGEITPKERRLLDRLAKSLGISPDRANQIENLMK